MNDMNESYKFDPETGEPLNQEAPQAVPAVPVEQAPQYQEPQYQAPQYQAPQYQAPQYQAPQYQAPQYQAPQYQEPQYQQPQYQQPQHQQPQYQAPQYQAPQYQEPQYQQPQYQQPQYQQPQYQQAPQYQQPQYQAAQPAGEAPKPGMIMGFGIAALATAVTFWLGVAGIVFGILARKKAEEYDRAGGAASSQVNVGRKLGQAGFIVGIIMSGILLIYLTVLIFMAI